ncbi:MAG TPA: hypothetical protein VGG04_04905 [Candidatus Sulfotelmatobacter sp.]|jgi:hypothetical protein
MTFRSCAYEKEVGQALKDGHWPEGCAPELRVHVGACASCSDFVLVTRSFQHAKRESLQESPAGSPGLLWWRAQLRRRNAAAERVSRPITIAGTFAWIMVLLMAVVFAVSQYNHGLHWAVWWAGLEPARFFLFLSGDSARQDTNLLLLIIPGLGVLALLSGLAAYLASEKS